MKYPLQLIAAGIAWLLSYPLTIVAMAWNIANANAEHIRQLLNPKH